MSLDVHTTLLERENSEADGMILMVLREQSEEDDEMNTAGELVISTPQTLREWELTLKERRGFWE